MYLPTLISRMSPFPILSGVGQYFSFFSNLYANSEDPDQTPHYAVSDLGLHCLPLSHKKDIGLIWVKNMSAVEAIWSVSFFQ